MIKKQFSIIVFLFGWLAVSAQEVSVKATLDSTHLLIGGQMNVTLEVNQPAGMQVQFPTFTDTLTRSVEILDASTPDTSLTDDQRSRIIQRLTITSFDSGYQVIPPLAFLVKNQNGRVDTLLTNSLGLDVLLVAVDTSQAIMPIKGPADMPYTLQDALPWILGGLLAIAIAIGLFLYFKKRKKPEEVVRAKPKEAPHVIAFRELDKLKEEHLWQSGELKAYYSRLTDIVREYIEHRFQIHTLERTSDEVLASFKNAGLADQVPFENLQQLLYQADLVKFAKGKPQPEDNMRSLEQAYDFVKQTIKEVLSE
ncbi:MAG: hypothetical protein R2825_29605 [Saprospiraceae bacterium]